MDRIPSGRTSRRDPRVAELASRERVRELAGFLGLNPQTLAESLIEAVERDPSLRRHASLHHAA